VRLQTEEMKTMFMDLFMTTALYDQHSQDT
jgi:hypothetical protein